MHVRIGAGARGHKYQTCRIRARPRRACAVFEKAAVLAGGGFNHRYNLSTAVMLKDNHIDAAGGVTKAIQMARAHASLTCTVEIECENLDMVREAADTQVPTSSCSTTWTTMA